MSDAKRRKTPSQEATMTTTEPLVSSSNKSNEMRESAESKPEQEVAADDADADAEREAEKAARQNRILLRRAEEKRERERRDAIERRAAEIVEQDLSIYEDEVLEAIKDAIDAKIEARDIEREWAFFDRLDAKVGDTIMFVDSIEYGEALIKKATIMDIEDHAEIPPRHDQNADPYNPRDNRPTFTVKTKARKKTTVIRPSRVRQITKTVTL